ncbi:hypothetical protein Pmar_PMAR000553 [Perkinsus marinus ATCC 50983]|uniref:Uncharacterized protein n=1 Tax=Perkinsus marinus (strain ATCC 50983 / TXsc) TaxID=423536 RepID=C5LIY0_PERM5|nr:hypothetical protein Pmar_PMAR000553 [Perkinsus marinus ATCC 50983]EER03315.1 hypothetical protein Pmar_PMAR000553 [Perkinsus marinus ATCC 50983]|eukprot:XP_002771499.1 hypothetical protein Pmar_PMAR000553 [Perkinsus marinus ATCC 50983]
MSSSNNAADDGAQRVWRTNAGNYYHVLDLVITDPEVTLRARKVIRATFLIFLTLCARAALLLADGEPLMQTLVGIAFVAVIPAFGYWGAKKASPTLMSLFCLLMLIHASHATALLIYVLVAAFTDGCIDEEDPSRPGMTICRKIDWNWMFTIAVVLLAVWAVLAFYASYQGYKLFVKLASGDQVATTQEGTSSAYEMDQKDGEVTYGKPVSESTTPVSNDDIEMGKAQQPSRRHGSSTSLDSGVL